jgi:hypothetical protein
MEDSELARTVVTSSGVHTHRGIPALLCGEREQIEGCSAMSPEVQCRITRDGMEVLRRCEKNLKQKSRSGTPHCLLAFLARVTAIYRCRIMSCALESSAICVDQGFCDSRLSLVTRCLRAPD